MTGPGIHLLPPSVYHDDPAPQPSLSSSLARLIMDRSPRHAWAAHPRLNPNHTATESATFDIGRAAHRAILGRGEDYVAYPDDLLAANGAASTKAAKEWAEEQRAAGRTPLKADTIQAVDAMATAAKAHLAACGIRLNPERSELTAIAQIDGVWCRAMVDNAPTDPRLPIYDVKTTTDAAPEAVIRAVATYGYDRQLAFYRSVWQAATGERRRFRLVMVEKEPPCACSVVELHDKPGDEADWFDHAESANAEAIRTWGQCLSSGIWPAYPTRVAVIGAPSWHTGKMEARLDRALTTKPDQATVAHASAWQAPQGVTA